MASVGVECSVTLKVAGKAIQPTDVIELTENLYEGSYLRTRVPGDPELDAKPGNTVQITFQAAGSTDARKIELWCAALTRYEDGALSFYELEAVDPMRLLNMETQFSTYRGKRTLANLAEEVLKRHLGPLAGAIAVGSKAPSVDAAWLLQCNETGAEFIHRIARTCGVIVYWNGTELSFGEIAKPSGSDAPVKLALADTLISSCQQFRLGITEQTVTWVDPVTQRCQVMRVGGEGLTSAGSGQLGRRISSVSRPNGVIATSEGGNQCAGELLSAVTTQSNLVMGRSVQSANCTTYCLQSITHVIQPEGSYTNHIVAIEPNAWGMLTPSVRGRLVGPFTATVVENNDPARYGRIRVRLDEDRQGLTTPWVSIMTGQSSASRGCFWLPEVGDRVIVMVPEDCPENLVALGSIRGENSRPDQQWASSENAHKVLAFRNGLQIHIDDTEEILRFETRAASIELTGEGKLIISARDIEVKAGNTIDLKAQGIMRLDGRQIHLGT